MAKIERPPEDIRTITARLVDAIKDLADAYGDDGGLAMTGDVVARDIRRLLILAGPVDEYPPIEFDLRNGIGRQVFSVDGRPYFLKDISLRARQGVGELPDREIEIRLVEQGRY